MRLGEYDVDVDHACLASYTGTMVVVIGSFDRQLLARDVCVRKGSSKVSTISTTAYRSAEYVLVEARLLLYLVHKA